MIVGTRVVYPEELEFWDAELIQISVYRGLKDNLYFMRECAGACKKADISFVIHPVRYSLLREDMLNDLIEMAECTDLALILHDEKTSDGKRLEGAYETRFRGTLDKLKSITHVSIENASDTGDIQWFWNNFADSITLDIGHVESSGLDSIEFVRSLDKDVIKKIQFVHMHRNNGLRGGITDHWPLTPDCREIKALKELINIKSDLSVILEINEIEQIDESLDMLRALKE